MSKPEGSYDIRTVEEFLGHRRAEKSMIYAHILIQGPSGVHSRMDEL